MVRACGGYQLPVVFVRIQFLRDSDVLEFPTFNSVKVKPRPARTRRLYLSVGHRTIGLNLSTGRGATADAFARRALRRLSFRPGYRFQIRYSSSCLSAIPSWVDLPGRSERGLVAANPFGNLARI